MNHENELYKVKRVGFKCGFIKGDKTVTLLLTEADEPLRKIRLTITPECENINIYSLVRAVELNHDGMEQISTRGEELWLKAVEPFWYDLGDGDGEVTLTMYMNAINKSNQILGV